MLDAIASYAKGLSKRSNYAGEAVLKTRRESISSKENQIVIKKEELERLKKDLDILRAIEKKRKEKEDKIREEKERIEKERKAAIRAAWKPKIGDIIKSTQAFKSSDDQAQ